MKNTIFDNSLNNLNIFQKIIEGSDLGFLDLSYNSRITLTGVKLYGIRALKMSVIESSKESQIEINGNTLITNCSSTLYRYSISLTQPFIFEMSDTTFINSNGIYIEFMDKKVFKLTNVKFYD